MANGHGGARTGAGRKPNNEKYASQIGAAYQRIADHLPQLIENLITLADGVTVKETDADGVVDIYAKPPDRKANEYLINRIAGTPTQHIEADVDGDGPLFKVYIGLDSDQV